MNKNVIYALIFVILIVIFSQSITYSVIPTVTESQTVALNDISPIFEQTVYIYLVQFAIIGLIALLLFGIQSIFKFKIIDFSVILKNPLGAIIGFIAIFVILHFFALYLYSLPILNMELFKIPISDTIPIPITIYVFVACTLTIFITYLGAKIIKIR